MQLKQRVQQMEAEVATCKLRLQATASSAEAQRAEPSVQAQVRLLRRQLEEKEERENAIEGKHSKLTEVYRALESECQAELQRCRVAETSPAASPPSLDGDGAPVRLFGSSGHCDLRLLLLAFVAGGVAGWLARGPANGRRRGAGALHVEEMRGWMPIDMKLS